MGNGHRQLSGTAGTILTLVATLMIVYHILWVSPALDLMGINIALIPHRAITLIFITIIAFMVLPATRSSAKDKVPWYDILLIVAGTAGPLYLVFFWQANVFRLAQEDYYIYEYVLVFLTVLTLLETTRRVLGPAMPLITLFFIVYMFTSDHFPGFMYNAASNIGRGADLLFFTTEGIFGIALGVASTIIIMFVIFGQVLLVSGAGEFFINLATSLLGFVRGGPAKAAIVGSALFGTMTGSVTANVATVGVFTIPMMKKIGYSPDYAGGVESVASTGGQIMPPIMGATAFLMAEWLGISYWSVAVAAFLPALLYYVGLFVMVDGEAGRLGLRGLPRNQCPSLRKTLQAGWSNLLPLVVVIIFLGWLRYSAQYSIMFALAFMLILVQLTKKTRLGPKGFLQISRNVGTSILAPGTGCACAGLMTGALAVTQLGMRLSEGVVAIAGGNLMVLLMLAAVSCFVLGTGLEGIPAYVMMVIFVAPALLKLGVLPLAAHLFVFYWAVTAFITPPVALAAFVAAGISGGSIMRTSLIAMKLGVAVYIVSFMFVYQPALLLIGSPAEIAMAFVSAIVGVTFVAWALAGHGIRAIPWLLRVPYLTGGILFILPGWTNHLTGLAVGGSALIWQMRSRLFARRASEHAP